MAIPGIIPPATSDLSTDTGTGSSSNISLNPNYTVRARRRDSVIQIEQMSGGMVVRAIPVKDIDALKLAGEINQLLQGKFSE